MFSRIRFCRIRRRSASLRLNEKPWLVEADTIPQHANETLPVLKRSHVLAVESQQDLMEKSPTLIEETSRIFSKFRPGRHLESDTESRGNRRSKKLDVL